MPSGHRQSLAESAGENLFSPSGYFEASFSDLQTLIPSFLQTSSFGCACYFLVWLRAPIWTRKQKKDKILEVLASSSGKSCSLYQLLPSSSVWPSVFCLFLLSGQLSLSLPTACVVHLEGWDSEV